MPTTRAQSLFWSLLSLVPTTLFGILLLHYWRSGDLNLLIHPAYHILTIVTGLFLIGLTVAKVLTLFRPQTLPNASMGHVRPRVQLLQIFVLSSVAIIGFIVPPQVFASSLSSDRSVADFLTLNRSEPESFRVSQSSAERGIVDWVRTLNVYPEPDAYGGDAVDVTGFVLHPSDLPDNYLLVARFIITCCAADVYPVGLPVHLGEGSRQTYPADQWVHIKGSMTTGTFGTERKAVIEPESIEQIEEPENPYES